MKKIKVNLVETISHEWNLAVPDDLDTDNIDDVINYITENEDFNDGELSDSDWNVTPLRNDAEVDNQ